MTPSRGKTVLLVEDDPDERFLFQKAWEAAGVENPLRMLDDGRQMIAYLSGSEEFADRTRFPIPALALIDIKLPLQSGFELLEWIRRDEGLKHLPVIMLTASAHPNDVETARRLGANSFVVKPSSAQELTELAAALKSYWLRFHEGR